MVNETKQEPAVMVLDEWIHNVKKNTTVKNHGTIVGYIKSRYGTTYYGPAPKVCGQCGKPATHRCSDGWYWCNKHKSKREAADRARKVPYCIDYFRLKFPGSTDKCAPGERAIGGNRHPEAEYVEIE